MDIKKCELFTLTAETENISKTAELSGYTQSGVSHTLKAFEEEVGVTLFKRDRYGVHLTPIAKELLPYVKRLVKENEKINQFINELHGNEQGTITIGIPLDYPDGPLPDILHHFHNLHPGIGIVIKEGSPEEIIEWVLNLTTDLGIHSSPVPAQLGELMFDQINLKMSIKNKSEASPNVMQLLRFLENYLP